MEEVEDLSPRASTPPIVPMQPIIYPKSMKKDAAFNKLIIILGIIHCTLCFLYVHMQFFHYIDNRIYLYPYLCVRR